MFRVRTKASRGSGSFLAIIVLLVLIVALLGIFQMTFSRQVISQVKRSALGDGAVVLAESAIQEALVSIRQRVNDPSDELYTMLRKDVLLGSAPSIEIPIAAPELQNLLSKKRYSHYSLHGLEAQVNFRRLFSSVPYENYGLITCSASIGTRLGLTDTIVRTVHTSCEFKVALLGPPRPFDQVTLMVTDTNYLVRDANLAIREAIRELDEARVERDGVLQRLREQRSRLAGRMQVLQALKELRAVIVPKRKRVLKTVHFFDDPLTIFTVRKEVRLADVDLPTRLEKTNKRIEDGRRQWRHVHERLERYFDSDTAHIAYRDGLREFVNAHLARLAEIKAFQDTFTEFSGRARDKFSRFFFKLDQDEWRGKAFHQISGANGDVNKQLDELRQTYQPLNGIVYIDNPEQLLDLQGMRGAFQGRVVLVTSGSAMIGGGPTERPENALLTVVTFGNLSVTGRCRASLIANRRISVDGDGRILGNLIMREVRTFGGLQGSVNYDTELYSGRTVPGDASGAFPGYYYVAIAPGESFQNVERK